MSSQFWLSYQGIDCEITGQQQAFEALPKGRISVGSYTGAMQPREGSGQQARLRFVEVRRHGAILAQRRTHSPVVARPKKNPAEAGFWFSFCVK